MATERHKPIEHITAEELSFWMRSNMHLTMAWNAVKRTTVFQSHSPQRRPKWLFSLGFLCGVLWARKDLETALAVIEESNRRGVKQINDSLERIGKFGKAGL